MGASDWDYFTRWHPDVHAAFNALKEEAAGDQDPMELLLNAGEDMTHSILDIIGGISDTYYDARGAHDFLQAFPVSPAWLLKNYGTIRPTRQMVEGKPEVFEDLERGTALFFAVWGKPGDKGNPDWWYFYGCTGD